MFGALRKSRQRCRAYRTARPRRGRKRPRVAGVRRVEIEISVVHRQDHGRRRRYRTSTGDRGLGRARRLRHAAIRRHGGAVPTHRAHPAVAVFAAASGRTAPALAPLCRGQPHWRQTGEAKSDDQEPAGKPSCHAGFILSRKCVISNARAATCRVTSNSDSLRFGACSCSAGRPYGRNQTSEKPLPSPSGEGGSRPASSPAGASRVRG